jgi:methionine-S-sulfoxide reductase
VGYAGGTKQNPTYRSLGDHTETVQIDYDPSRISYKELLRAFWTGHDPSYRSWSRQYASIIFVHNDEQLLLARESKIQIEQERGKAVHTEIINYSGFTLAEDYHQKHGLRQFPEFVEELMRIYPSSADYVASTAVARLNGYLGGEGSYDALKEEADSLGLSSVRKEKLLRLVQRRVGSQTCSVPAAARIP